MANSLRIKDSADEIEVGKFLDKYFYPVFTKNQIRYSDKEHQLLGIDVKFDYNNLSGLLADEKAASQYVNQDLPTFAFEVDFLNSMGELSKGWLFDDKKTTEYYLLSWLWAKVDKGITSENITKVDLIILERKRTIEMLSKYGINWQSAQDIARQIRSDGKYGVHHKDVNKPFYFFYSSQLAEKPVNIIIRKAKLIELMSTRHILKP